MINDRLIVLCMLFAITAKIESADDKSPYYLDSSRFKISLTDQGRLDKMLFSAVKKCDVQAIEKLLAAGANVNAKHREHALRPLHCAAQTGCLEPVDLLLQKGARVNASSASGTALHFAVNFPENPAQARAIVARLFKAGADPNIEAPSLKRTALGAICLGGVYSLEDKYAIPVVFQFLAAGVDRSAIVEFGLTAVSWALEYSRPALVELIESYPGRNLQELTIFSFAKNYYKADPAGQEKIEQAVMLMPAVALAPHYINLFYKLIGKEQLVTH